MSDDCQFSPFLREGIARLDRERAVREAPVVVEGPDDDDYIDRPALARTHPYGNGAA